MQPRRSFALVATALLLCVPALSSCGFNKATERPYTQANGVNYKTGPVYVLNAVIAAAQPNSGTLVASLSNNSESKTETLESVAGGGGNTVTAADFTPVAIDPMGFTNLADADDITLSGAFDAGDVIPLSLTFEDGSTISMDVPVVYACQEYAGLDTSQAAATASASSDSTAVASTATVAASPTQGASDGATASSTTTEASSAASPSSYTCGTTGSTGGRN